MNYLRRISDCPVCDSKTASPFAFYENEVFVKTEPCSTRIFLSDLDRIILVIVNKLLYTTSNQLILVLRREGVMDEPCFIQKRLRKLVDAEYLIGGRFENKTDSQKHSSNKVYRLGWRGAAFLNHNHIKPRLGHYLDTLNSSYQIKKLLATNQYLLYTEKEFEDFSLCEPVCVPSGTRNVSTNQIFRSQARLQTDEGIVFIEAIRQQPDWKAEMEEKLTRMGHILRAFTEHDCSILLIGENEDHMKEIMTWFKNSFDTYPVTVIYTADTLTYTDPKNCLYSLRTTHCSILDWFFKEA